MYRTIATLTLAAALAPLTGCAFGPYPRDPAPAPVPTVAEPAPVEAPSGTPQGTGPVAPPVRRPAAGQVIIGTACAKVDTKACDGNQPALCAGDAREQVWVFNLQVCDAAGLPDCWRPSPIAVGGCVAGCELSTGTCVGVGL